MNFLLILSKSLYPNPKNRQKLATKKQTKKPKTVGVTMERNVHLKLAHSFFIVRQVVEQGQCIKQKSDVQRAVSQVQPLSANNIFNSAKFSYSTRLPRHKYAMIIMGITISFAGNPRIKATNMTPSSPKIFANGSRKFEI